MKSTTASINNQRDCISVFIDAIAQCKSEEWRRKITAMQNLIVGLDLQQHEYIASISGRSRTSSSSPGGAAGPAALGRATEAHEEEEDDDTAENYSLKSVESNISALSTPSKAGSVQSTASHNYYSHVRSRYQQQRLTRPPPYSPSRLPNSSMITSPRPTTATVTTPSSSSPEVAVSPAVRRSAGKPQKHHLPLYMQPKELHRLVPTFRKLFADLRSQVVKAACTNLTILCEKSGNHARFLIRDLIPDIIDLHRQTVKVMHGYALSCLLSVIHHTTLCTKGLTVLLQESRCSKSKDVRCACVRYLHEVIAVTTHSGTTTTNNNNIIDNNSSNVRNAEIIGKTLAKALLDPSQQVRIEARLAFDTFRTKYPELWEKLVVNEETCVIKDVRLQKSLVTEQQQQHQSTLDDLLINGGDTIIHSSHSTNTIPNPFEKLSILTPAPKGVANHSNSGNLSGHFHSTASSEPLISTLDEEAALLTPTTRSIVALNNGNDDGDDDEVAKFNQRRKTMSTMFKERLVQSTLKCKVDDQDRRASLSSPLIRSTTTSDEVVDDDTALDRIAHQLYTAHKCFIDKEMETIQLERNLLLQIENLLLHCGNTKGDHHHTSAPSDTANYQQQVLEYFESVGIFLEQHTILNKMLLDSMEGISKGHE
jgi:hypothetical protein